MPNHCIDVIDKAFVCDGDRLHPKRAFAFLRCQRMEAKDFAAKGFPVMFNREIFRTAQNIRPPTFGDGSLQCAGVLVPE